MWRLTPDNALHWPPEPYLSCLLHDGSILALATSLPDSGTSELNH